MEIYFKKDWHCTGSNSSICEYEAEIFFESDNVLGASVDGKAELSHLVSKSEYGNQYEPTVTIKEIATEGEYTSEIEKEIINQIKKLL